MEESSKDVMMPVQELGELMAAIASWLFRSTRMRER
jgi:hypothetical protein